MINVYSKNVSIIFINTLRELELWIGNYRNSQRNCSAEADPNNSCPEFESDEE